MTQIATPADPSLFAGRYKIERLLGEGGMGKVYVAHDTLLDNEPVALKILRSDLAHQGRHAQRFLREIAVARKVTDASVVRTYDGGISKEGMYLSMELVQGKSVKEILAEGPLSERRVREIALGICTGLNAIHRAGIVHRDLKPGNIIITTNNTVKIADFGVAHSALSTLTGDQEMVGSAAYLPPEIWLGRAISPATDLYSLGVMLYEMVSGELPFEADSTPELMYKHLQVEPVPLVTLVPGISREFDAIVRQLLAKSASSRIASAEVLARELNAIAQPVVPEIVGDHHAPPSRMIERTPYFEFQINRQLIEQCVGVTSVLGAGFALYLFSQVWPTGPLLAIPLSIMIAAYPAALCALVMGRGISSAWSLFAGVRTMTVVWSVLLAISFVAAKFSHGWRPFISDEMIVAAAQFASSRLSAFGWFNVVPIYAASTHIVLDLLCYFVVTVGLVRILQIEFFATQTKADARKAALVIVLLCIFMGVFALRS
jgi:Protein kinase domain